MAAATVSSGHRVAVSHPGRPTDVAIVSAAFAGSLLAVLNGGFGVTHQGPAAMSTVAVVLVAGCTLPLLGWRHTPLTAFLVTGAANVALAAIVHPIGLPLGPAVAIYAMAANRDLATPWLTRTTTMVTALFVAYLAAAAVVERTFPWVELVHGALLWAAFWLAGERARLRREQIAELKREARRERQLATAEERARIARDLHDSAGHAINVIGVRAGAARLRHHEDPERSLVALEAIEELARQTAADIDRLVGVLRSPDDRDPIVAPTGIASVPSLIAHHRAAGLDVTHRVAGAPRALSSVVDQAA